jgi:hypothetical protein
MEAVTELKPGNRYFAVSTRDKTHILSGIAMRKDSKLKESEVKLKEVSSIDHDTGKETLYHKKFSVQILSKSGWTFYKR